MDAPDDRTSGLALRPTRAPASRASELSGVPPAEALRKSRVQGVRRRWGELQSARAHLRAGARREATYDAICIAMREASLGSLAGVLGYTDEQVVSSDLRGGGLHGGLRRQGGLQLDPAGSIVGMVTVALVPAWLVS